MAMNPDTNRFEDVEMTEEMKELLEKIPHQPRSADDMASMMRKFADNKGLVRPDGSPVPKHWTVFNVGEEVVIKNYTFRVVLIREDCIMFEPVRPVVLGSELTEEKQNV